MIDYKHFHFAGAPRTGTTWFIHAMYAGGLGEGNKAKVHIPFEKVEHPKCLRVSTIRHPCDWLASYFKNVHRATLAIPCVDQFNSLPTDDFQSFIRMYLRKMPGAVGRMFLGYRSHSVLRMEDYPWNVIDLLEAIGIPKKQRETCLSISRLNFSKELPIWTPALKERVEIAEKKMMEEYDY